MAADLIVWTILQDDAGRVLLGRRSGTRFADGYWNLPGGAVETREPLLEAARRELREETGVRVERADLRHIGVNRYDVEGLHGRVQGLNFFFLARRWQGEPEALDHTSEVGWFDPAGVPADALPWLQDALDTHLKSGQFFSETLD